MYSVILDSLFDNCLASYLHEYMDGLKLQKGKEELPLFGALTKIFPFKLISVGRVSNR
jgi:hypothetical protein